MSNEDKKEILKAHFYNYPISQIASIYGVEEREIQEIIDESADFLKELGERAYD